MNPKEYITFNSIIDRCKEERYDLRISHFHSAHKGLCLKGKMPVSITEVEFNYMKDTILKYDLKQGFELATGVGISTLAAGLGFKKTKGQLLTVDSYIEFSTQKEELERTDGDLSLNYNYKFVQELKRMYDLDNVYAVQGWSPVDCIEFLDEFTKEQKLDYVFLDCPKCDNDLHRDLSYLTQYLAEKYVIFIHDVIDYEHGEDICKQYLGKPYRKIYNYEFNGKIINVKFPLAVIENI